MRLLHTMIRVNDLDESLTFYCDHLGMKLLRRQEYPGGRFTLAFVGYGDEASHSVIELTYNWDTHQYDLGNAFGHLAIGVPDIYKFCDAAARQGGQDRARTGAHEARQHRDRVRRRPERLPHRTHPEELIMPRLRLYALTLALVLALTLLAAAAVAQQESPAQWLARIFDPSTLGIKQYPGATLNRKLSVDAIQLEHGGNKRIGMSLIAPDEPGARLGVLREAVRRSAPGHRRKEPVGDLHLRLHLR